MFSISEWASFIVAGVTAGTALWHAAMYVGRLTLRVEDHSRRIDDHEDRLDDQERVLRQFKGV